MKDEKQIFEKYIQGKSLKHSEQRLYVLEVFLGTEKHVSADELYRIVKKKNPKIGQATVYRTLKLICESGIAREVKFDGKLTRYEHLYGHEHHDHLICLKCGKFEEVVNTDIEKLQEEVAKRNGFLLESHRLEMFGLCKKCR